MLIDFGEETLSKTTHIHFMCLLLRYSRFLCVYAQDHKYNSEEACKAILPVVSAGLEGVLNELVD